MLSGPCRLLRVAKGGWMAMRGGRVVARRPVKVHQSITKEAEEASQQYKEVMERVGVKKNVLGSQKSESHQQTAKAASNPDTDAHMRSRIRYKLLSEANSYEKTLLSNTKSQKYCNEHEVFVAEGYRIIREALEQGATPLAIYFTRLKLVTALKGTESELNLSNVLKLSDLPLFKAPYKTLQTWSSMVTSPGIIGVFRIPKAKEADTQSSPDTRIPLTLVLDELREPGNLGGLLRTAAAVGVHQVLLMKGCCDPWEAKVVRGGCGAQFRLKFSTKIAWEKLSYYLPPDANIFLADTHHGENQLAEDEEELEDTDTRELEESDASLDSTSEDNVYEVDEEGNRVAVDVKYSDSEHLKRYQKVSLPILSYDKLGTTWLGKGAVLIVGSEVGVSNAAKKFVADNFGSRVTVPLANGMDSLNVGVASGVILYEMQKQLLGMTKTEEWKERRQNKG